jgi:hypothetical protein
MDSAGLGLLLRVSPVPPKYKPTKQQTVMRRVQNCFELVPSILKFQMVTYDVRWFWKSVFLPSVGPDI